MTRRARELDTRQRMLCRHIVAGMDQKDAALAAGYAPSVARNDLIGKLLAQPLFQDELARLRAEQAVRLNISMDRLILELVEDREACRALNRPEGAANITMKIAVLLGFTGDRPVMDITIINKPLPYPTREIEMSVDEWVSKWSPKAIGNGHE